MSIPSRVQASVPITVVPVREDHLAAIVRFISLQRTVVKAAVPRHLYGMQAEAHTQLVELLPIIDTYRFAEDTATITVNVGETGQQRMLVSPKALTRDIKEMNEAKPTGDKVCIPSLKIDIEKLMPPKKSNQLKGNDTAMTKTRAADTLTQPQNSITNESVKIVKACHTNIFYLLS